MKDSDVKKILVVLDTALAIFRGSRERLTVRETRVCMKLGALRHEILRQNLQSNSRRSIEKV